MLSAVRSVPSRAVIEGSFPDVGPKFTEFVPSHWSSASTNRTSTAATTFDSSTDERSNSRLPLPPSVRTYSTTAAAFSAARPVDIPVPPSV